MLYPKSSAVEESTGTSRALGKLTLIVTVFKSTEPTFGPEFTSLKFDIGDDFASLTILKADQDDEGIYHCANTERIGVKWSGTYLLVKGNKLTCFYKV